ncbi:DMT family transporter [Exilibacterium tricleocarpae]|uniref:DMT family transporter n=1 Tax=Exilibacterium tricleocarpae TaxID=2591008 RepID=A0A545SSR4_9GAMM|nr:DMT family transporter [Exilibacterium tricleocarpae]TQV67987.1 DMT family transporter [Exilibacterium tricleocarpae]
MKIRSYRFSGSSLLELHLAVLLLGMTGLFGKFLAVNPATIIAGRSLFTAVAIYALLRLLGISRAVKSTREAGLLLISGLVLALHWFAFFYSIQLSTVAIGVIGFSTYPVFVTLMEPLLFGERLKLLDMISGLLVFAGLLLVVPDFDITDSQTLALAWAVASGWVLALFTLMNRKLVRRNHFLLITFYQHTSATLCVLPFVGLLGAWPDAGEIAMLALLGVIFTAIPQSLLVRALAVVKAQLASVIVGLEPLYAIAFAALLLREIPSLTTVAGALVILFAVWVAIKSHAEPRRSGRPAEHQQREQSR